MWDLTADIKDCNFDMFVSTGELFNNCSCKDDRTIFIHDSWEDLEAAVRQFETEDVTVAEMLNQPAITDSVIVGPPSLVPFEGREMHKHRCSRMLSESPNEINIVQLETLSDHKQHQEEAESEPEAFRVKRRRVFPRTWRRFQVDEQKLTTEKSMV